MKITPIAKAQAEKHHWIVKWLRFCGYCIIIASGIIGSDYFGRAIKLLIVRYFVASADFADWFGKLLGALLGMVAGLFLSLSTWGLSLVIDDLHALRIYASGFVTEEEPKVDK